MNKILLIEDNQDYAFYVIESLKRSNADFFWADTADKGLRLLQQEAPSILLLDINLPDRNGVDLIESIMAIAPSIKVIMISAYFTPENLVSSLKRGALECVDKDSPMEHLCCRIEEMMGESKNIHKLCQKIIPELSLLRSTAMSRLICETCKVSNTEANILLRGETGTGKNFLAELIYRNSPREKQNFITIDCSAIPNGLIESELFGHERGAFTGAITRKIGKVEAANHGTLFLDEVGELPFEVQAKLLRFIQNGEFERIGGNSTMKVDARIIAATNRPLEQLVKEGRFREDLYHRLSVVPLAIPPLRDRPMDIAPLALLFFEQFCQKYNKRLNQLNNQVLDFLAGLPLYGNVRELKNLLERAVVIAEQKDLGIEDFRLIAPAQDMLEDWEYRDTVDALKKSKGNVSQAAILLGISRGTLYRRMDLFNIRSNRRRAS